MDTIPTDDSRASMLIRAILNGDTSAYEAALKEEIAEHGMKCAVALRDYVSLRAARCIRR